MADVYQRISPSDQWIYDDNTGDLIGVRRRGMNGADLRVDGLSTGQLADLTGASTATPTSSDTVVGVQGGVVKRFLASALTLFSGMQFQAGRAANVLLRNSSTGATRMHIEPNGNPSGTAAKLDLMFHPYEANPVDYGILNAYTKTYSASDASTTQGNGGVGVIGLKNVGTHWGIWPTLHIGFSDDGEGGAVPLKLYYFDTSDSSWRTPMLGGWRAGMSVTTGDYVTASNKIYQATTTGTTGATVPSHAAGNASDGAVSWDFVYAPVANNVKGCVVFGDRDDLPKFGLPTVRAQYAGPAAFWNNVSLQFLNSSSTATWKLSTHNLVDDLYIDNSDGTKFLRFGSTFIQDQGLSELLSTKTIADNSATPDVTGTRIVIFNNGSATNITSMAGSARQRLIVQATNGNTTLVHSASLVLNTGANKVLTANSCLQFIFNGAGTACTEVGTL